MGLGFVVARFGLFLHELASVRSKEPVVETGGSGLSLWVGVGLVTMGIFVLIGAGSRYRRYVACLIAGENPPAPGSAFGLIVTGVLVVGGAGLIAYLLGVR
jgi:putative membrane protein